MTLLSTAGWRYFKRIGVPAITNLPIKIVGDYPYVIGFPDIIAHEPGKPWIVIEIKTGLYSYLRRSQSAYIPVLQYGNHIYTTDPRIYELGHEVGVPFPPMQAVIIYAIAPGEPLDIRVLPPPEIATPK
jgi:hypothetical protein